MPISYRLDQNLKMVFTTASGLVTDDDLIDHARKVCADSDVPVGARALVDFRDVQEVEVATETIHQVADIFRASTYAPKTAFVTNANVIYGMSRMFEMLRDDSPNEIRVFRVVDEAKCWLGIP